MKDKKLIKDFEYEALSEKRYRDLADKLEAAYQRLRRIYQEQGL